MNRTITLPLGIVAELIAEAVRIGRDLPQVTPEFVSAQTILVLEREVGIDVV